MSIRKLFFNALANDGALNALGIDGNTLYPAPSADAPQERIWATLRWGGTQPGVGPVSKIDLDVWVYNRDPDYGPIDLILRRARVVLPALYLSPLESGGNVVWVDWQGAGNDGRDPAYDAVFRTESYRITSSGI
jgi:hypothetical protein